MNNAKNSFALKIFFSLLILITSWFAIGIGFTMSGNPQLAGGLLIGGLFIFFLSGAALIYFFVKQIQN